MMLLRAENLHKEYLLRKHTVDVLRGASLEVAEGETVAIVGISGAGKSTLLHILGGLDQPSSGSVWMRDTNLYQMNNVERSRLRAESVGFVFQSYHLLPEMDVLENVMLPAMAVTGVFGSSSRLKRRAAQLLDAVGLADRADHTPLELSGGEQQRVALARALMNSPALILADEPTGNLDAGTGGQVLDYLFSLVRDRQQTLVLVTHDEKVAAACDRVLRLKDGTVVTA